ncbi:hypothetical protein [Sulfurovum sp.]
MKAVIRQSAHGTIVIMENTIAEGVMIAYLNSRHVGSVINKG